MSLLNTMVASAAESHLTTPAWIFPVIAATIFVALGFITWSFRDVANRHSDKVSSEPNQH